MKEHYELVDSESLLLVRVLIDTMDFYEISEAAGYLRSELSRRSYPSTVFDLSRVEFIDSSVFGFFIEVRNHAKKNGNDVSIVCNNRDILHIMSMLKIHEIMRVFNSLDEAMASLRS
jgi:anti-anti-sigma factor